MEMSSWQQGERPRQAKPDSKVEKWQQWLDVIAQDVVGLFHRRSVFQTIAQIVNANDALPPSLFYDYLRDTYSAMQAVTVRRQAETRVDVISLGTLLAQIVDEPDRLTRERFCAHSLDVELAREAGEWFERQFAGSVGDHVDHDVVARDLEALRAAAHETKTHVDKRIAHADPKAPRDVLTFGELDNAIDVVGDLFKKYARLLTGSSWHTLVPEPQHDWTAVFRQPWIR